jgi:glutamate-ammonia-ligase adenylyltransferase
MCHTEYFGLLADRICKILTTITKEGTVYRVDIRLRPGGSAGRVAQSFAAFERHFAGTAELWETQAYLRARPIAGDLDLAEEFMASLYGLLYQPRAPERLAEEIAAMRRRMEVELTKEKSGQLHVKLGSGGIADIEFVVQFLQLTHGATLPSLRVGNTLKALEAARGAGLIADSDAVDLSTSYRFLRTVQNRLRVVSESETSSLP